MTASLPVPQDPHDDAETGRGAVSPPAPPRKAPAKRPPRPRVPAAEQARRLEAAAENAQPAPRTASKKAGDAGVPAKPKAASGRGAGQAAAKRSAPAAKSPTSKSAAAKGAAAKGAAAKSTAGKSASAKGTAARAPRTSPAPRKTTPRKKPASTSGKAAEGSGAEVAPRLVPVVPPKPPLPSAVEADRPGAPAEPAPDHETVEDAPAAETTRTPGPVEDVETPDAVSDTEAAPEAPMEATATVDAAEAHVAEPDAPVEQDAPVEPDAPVDSEVVHPEVVEPEVVEPEVVDPEIPPVVAAAEPAAADDVPERAPSQEKARSAAEQEPEAGAAVAALSVRGLVKQFGDTAAVAGIDLTVPAGTFYGIVGPNGAGKTTTLSMIAGLLRPDRGSIVVGGVDAMRDPRGAKRLLGVLPDRLRTFDRLTGRQLLYYFGVLRGLDPALVHARTADLARAFDLTEALARPVSDYSAGMTKKVMLAGAMIHSPRLLILDEPFEAVDPVSSAVILDILGAYVAHGGTVILSSHGMDLVERVCTRVAVLVGGQVLAEGTVDDVRGELTLEQRFVQLAGGLGDVEGLEWLHTFSD